MSSMSNEQDQSVTRYLLTSPVSAAQYVDGSSISAPANIVVKYRDRPSYDTMRGPLTFYNGGPEVVVSITDWVIDLEGELVVLPDALFRSLFVEAEESVDNRDG